MKAFIVTLVIVDHDEVGATDIKQILEDTRYPNWCIAPQVQTVVEHEIGEWTDKHPLNQKSTDAVAWLKENQS